MFLLLVIVVIVVIIVVIVVGIVVWLLKISSNLFYISFVLNIMAGLCSIHYQM